MPAAGCDPVWRYGSSSAQVAVIVALELEAKTLGRLPPAQRERVLVSGPGAARAARVAGAAIEAGADALVSWGLAGSLRRDLACGAVMLPARIRGAAGEWATDPAWRRRLAGVIGRRFALSEDAIYSADEVVDSPRAKEDLARRTAAAAVDMESAAIAAAAAAAGLPCVAIRVIADEPGDVLPSGVAGLLDAAGRVRYAGLAGLLKSPVEFGRLLRLAARSRRARRVLGELTLALLAESRA